MRPDQMIALSHLDLDEAVERKRVVEELTAENLALRRIAADLLLEIAAKREALASPPDERS
jgi:hypothetical protein